MTSAAALGESVTLAVTLVERVMSAAVFGESVTAVRRGKAIMLTVTLEETGASSVALAETGTSAVTLGETEISAVTLGEAVTSAI